MDRSRRLAVSLVLTAALVVVEVGFGLVAHSSGLLADAGHNLSDVGALALSLVAVRLTLRPPSAARDHPAREPPSRGRGRPGGRGMAAQGRSVVWKLPVYNTVHHILRELPRWQPPLGDLGQTEFAQFARDIGLTLPKRLPAQGAANLLALPSPLR